jgi:hypothetical protein
MNVGRPRKQAPPDTRRRLVQATAKVKAAHERYVDAVAARDDAIRQAARAGMSRREAAMLSGISVGRVQQIVDSDQP